MGEHYVDPVKSAPVFISIATCAHSGATLLAFLLGAHPRIATVGEMDGLILREDPDTYRCSCGDPIRTCKFWRAVGDVMQRRGHCFDVAHFDTKCELRDWGLFNRLRVGSFRTNAVDALRDWIFEWLPGEADRLKQLMERNRAFVNAVLKVTGKDIFVDSSKDRCRVRYLQRWSAMDIRIIHLVRDVRGVVTSHLRRKPTTDVRQCAREWVKENQRHERLRQWLPAGKSLRVRYEDICENPDACVQHLYSFLGASSTVVGDFRAAPHHIVGNAMRLETVPFIQLDKSWQTLLTVSELKAIDRVAGLMNRRYGYDQAGVISNLPLERVEGA